MGACGPPGATKGQAGQGLNLMDGVENPAAAAMAAAVERLGVCPDAVTRSRRHGFRPMAAEHVRRYLLARVAGVRAADMARAEGYCRSNIQQSIRLGAAIVRANVARLGLTAEDLLA